MRAAWQLAGSIGAGPCVLAAARSTRPVDPPIDRVDLAHGYRPQLHPTRKHRDDTQILVTFSGGGTRAAAFAYGVLEELRRRQVDAEKDRHPLLDEVDLLIGEAAMPNGARAPRFFAANVSFAALPDAGERQQLMAISTSFALPSGDVDHVRDAAARALRTSPAFKTFLPDLKESVE